jgi:large subunit ribosomal protein L13
MKSYMAKGETVERNWYVVDAEGQVLGRLSSQVAAILRGKHKPIYTPHVDTGDHVIIINAAKVRLTGKKLDQKKHIHHTGYPGGIREVDYRTLLATKPEFAVYESIRRMMPKGPLGDKMLKKVRIYAGPEHNNAAQKPQPLELKY